ncbi:MAG: sulfatase-like hydrolase/transferase [Steroidobacteraceae bacterium]
MLGRRGFIGGLAAGMAAPLVATGKNRDARPDILFIMADDMGVADIGVYGARHIRTPWIDSLAKDGLLLTQGYSNAATCTPTRVALATGCYQGRFPIGLEEPLGRKDHLGLPSDRPTLASALRGQGYRTALVGKWHLGGLPDYGPLQRGYESYFGLLGGAADYFRHRYNLDTAAPNDGLYRDDQPVEQAGYMTQLLGREAVQVIGKDDSRPLFLSLHFTAPHYPWEGPEDEAVSRSLKSINHWSGGSVETYAKMVEAMDTAVGEVLRAFKRRGRSRDGIVVFTSDNGGERFSDTWPYSGRKGELLEGGVRVPLLIRWPGHIKPGARSDQVMTSMDFLPTLLSAAGGHPEQAGQFDGENLLPVLLGQAASHERTLFWRFKANDQAAVRRGAWKYLRLGGKEHLFNLLEDARERAERKDDFPGLMNELKALYAGWEKQMLPYPADSLSESVKTNYPDRY